MSQPDKSFTVLRRGVLLALAASFLAAAQLAVTANQEYQTEALREKAASEMDHWVRPSVERTSELVASLGLRPGDAVADIGTGVGYLLPHLVAHVGPQGDVIAVDVYPDFVARARARIQAAGWRNVRAVLATERDPNLPPGRVDAAILLDTYHHLNYPEDTLRHVWRALKPRGRLIVIDFYRSRKHPGATDENLRAHIRLDRDDVVAEVEAQGFRLARSFDHLPHMYVLSFEKP